VLEKTKWFGKQEDEKGADLVFPCAQEADI